MKKKILITEDEKEYIKRLYGILNEQNYGFQPTALAPQNVTPPESYKKVVEGKNFGSFEERILFPAGYYSQRYMKSENLVKRLQELLNQVYPSKMSEGPFILNITTESSESKIPNTDNEKGGELNPGQLAKLRNTTINQFIRTFINENYPELTPPNFDVTINNTTPKIGTTAWVGSSYLQALVDCKIVNKIGDLVPNPNACTPKVREWVTNLKKNYDSEQYNGVKVELIRKGSETETKTPKPIPNKNTSCARNMKIRIYFNGTYNDHNCNNAVFEVYANDVLLNRDRDNQPFISLNNAGLMDNNGAKIVEEKVYAKDKTGKPYKKNGKYVQEIKYSVTSTDKKNASREDTLTITDELFESIPNIDTQLVLKFVCRNLNTWIKSPKDLPNFVFTNPNIGVNSGKFPYDISQWKTTNNYYDTIFLKWTGSEWYQDDNGWKNGCHTAVGSIDITNNIGNTITLELKTPTKKNQETKYPSIDPCSLQEKSQNLAKDTSLNQKNTEIKLK